MCRPSIFLGCLFFFYLSGTLGEQCGNVYRIARVYIGSRFRLCLHTVPFCSTQTGACGLTYTFLGYGRVSRHMFGQQGANANRQGAGPRQDSGVSTTSTSVLPMLLVVDCLALGRYSFWVGTREGKMWKKRKWGTWFDFFFVFCLGSFFLLL